MKHEPPARIEQSDRYLPPFAWPVIGILVLMTVESVLSTFTYPYFSLALERLGLSTWAIGLNASVAGAGILFVGPFLPRMIARYGIMPLAAGMYLLPLLCFVALLIFDGVVVWYAARFLMGACFAALWATTEIWLNAVVSDAQRGRMMSIAMVLYTSSQFLGPLMISATGVEGALPIIAAIVPLAMGAVLTFTISTGKPYKLEADAEEGESGIGFAKAFTLAPTLVVLAFLVGVVTTAVQSLFPLYGIGIGLSEVESANLVSALGFGEAILVGLFGIFADRFHRWRLLRLCTVPLILMALSMPLFATNLLALLGLLFALGGALGVLYTLTLILVGQDFTGHRMAVVSTGVAMAYSVGIIAAGPLGYLVDLFGPRALPVSISVGLVLLAVVIFVGGRGHHARTPALQDGGPDMTEPQLEPGDVPPLVPQPGGLIAPAEPALSGFHQRETIHVEEPEVRHLEMRDDRQRKERDLEERFRERAAEIARRRAKRYQSGAHVLEGLETDEAGERQSHFGSHFAL